MSGQSDDYTGYTGAGRWLTTLDSQIIHPPPPLFGNKAESEHIPNIVNDPSLHMKNVSGHEHSECAVLGEMDGCRQFGNNFTVHLVFVIRVHLADPGVCFLNYTINPKINHWIYNL